MKFNPVTPIYNIAKGFFVMFGSIAMIFIIAFIFFGWIVLIMEDYIGLGLIHVLILMIVGAYQIGKD